MKTEVTLKTEAHSPSHSTPRIQIRDLSLAIDEPTAHSDTHQERTPADTALATLIGSTKAIGRKCADRLGIDIGQMRIDASCQFDRRGVTRSKETAVPYSAVRLTVTVDGTCDDTGLQAVAIEVEKFRSLSTLFTKAGTQVETLWKKA